MCRYLFVAVLAIGIVGFALLFANRSSEVASPIGITPTRASATFMEQDRASLPSERLESTQAAPVELIGSVYEQELGFRQVAIEAVENTAKRYTADSLLRWAPAYINLEELFPDGYLNDSSMPTQFELTPFPDVPIIVDVTSFHVFEQSRSAFLEGSVRGSMESLVTISFSGGEEIPALIIYVQNPPQYIDVVPTMVPNAYIVVEHRGVSSGDFEP